MVLVLRATIRLARWLKKRYLNTLHSTMFVASPLRPPESANFESSTKVERFILRQMRVWAPVLDSKTNLIHNFIAASRFSRSGLFMYSLLGISHGLQKTGEAKRLKGNAEREISLVFLDQIERLRGGWLRWVGAFKSQVSFAKEPYKRDDILQKRHIILRSLLIVATP